jgi:dTDP-4-dehydrorhamnose reductase
MPIAHDDLGPAARLRETWQRYRRPIAVTEVHHGCTRDEQVRWLAEVWNAARQVKSEGADILAVAVWSLFGTVDWNSLLVRRDGCYEPGLFDARGPEPRATALAAAAKALASTGAYDHPVLDRAGWWRRDVRFYWSPTHRSSACRLVGMPRRILIVDAGGPLERALSRICDHRGLDHVLFSHVATDVVCPESVARVLGRESPWAVIDAAGFLRAADAKQEVETPLKEKAVEAEVLARACAEVGIPYATFSSDLVFDGRLGRAYVESDPPTHAGLPGAGMAEVERRALAVHEHALVIRAGALFGPWDRANFVWATLNALAAGRAVETTHDEISPTYVPDLIHELLNLLVDGASGIWHLANTGATSWYDFARASAGRAGLRAAQITAKDAEEPRCFALMSERGILMPPLEGAIDRFFRDSEAECDERISRHAAE